MRQDRKNNKDNSKARKEGSNRSGGSKGKLSIHKKKKKFNAFKDKQERQRKGDPVPSMSEDVRLNKYLSNAGICSRREADVLIQSGIVKINDKVCMEMGYKVKPTDKVQYDGATISRDTKRYILLNKPKGYVTSMNNPRNNKTVMTLVANACKEIIIPIDRLDRNTTGLLLFTNDNDLIKKLTHPQYEIAKLYQVSLDKPFPKNELPKLKSGIELEDGKAWASEAEFVNDDAREIGIQIRSNKQNVVRRMFEALGHSE
jgi:23S rRNA pseudouridine2605 synthase